MMVADNKKKESYSNICPICDSQRLRGFFVVTQEIGGGREMKLFSCEKCGIIFASDYRLSRNGIYGEDYAPWSKKDKEEEKMISQAKKTAFRNQIEQLPRDVLRKKGKALDVGTGAGYLLEILKEFGFDVSGTEVSTYWKETVEKKFPNRVFLGELETANFENEFFDLVLLTDVLEHLSDPKKTLREVGRILKPGGYLFLTSPNSDSVTRKLLGKKWFQYKYEHLFYFNRKSLNWLLCENNLRLVKFKNNWKKFSFNYYYYYFQKYSFFGIEKLIKTFFRLVLGRARNVCFSNPITGEFLAVARKD